MARGLRVPLAAVFALAIAANGNETLQNASVHVTIDPAQGGAVTRMERKAPPTVPLIAGKGAGLAGEGRLFVPTVSAGEVRLAAAGVKMQRLGGASARSLALSCDLSAVSPGLRLVRRFEMDANESGLRITDTYHNDGPGAREVALRVGAESRLDGHDWNRTLRCWVGDATTRKWLFTPYAQGNVSTLRSASERAYWRVVGQYGVGLLYLPTAAAGPVELTHRLPKEPGHPAEFDWLGGPAKLAPGARREVRSTVLIDLGGRDGGQPATPLGADRVLVHLDVPAAGRRGQEMDCFVTVTSAVPRNVRVVLRERYVLLDWAEGKSLPAEEAASFELALPPGEGVVRPVVHRPRRAGLMYLDCEVLDAAGRRLTATHERAVIDGAARARGEFAGTWDFYTQRLPEVRLRGTWEQIGRQMAERKLLRPGKGAAGGEGRLGFYERRFPYYARLLRGAAEALQVEPSVLAAAAEGSSSPPRGAACMGLLLTGPDGPLHLYSKERSGSSRSGMGYVRVVPDAGHRYHMYTLGGATFGYGVNDAGLSTSGATINCDDETMRVGQAETQRRRQAGKPAAPLGMHMLLATCADVAEALRFVTADEAPLDFTGNMLLADRAGNAAILESVGTYHQVVRRERGRLASMGNYPHRRADGRFDIGANWGWAANTMLRERFVGSLPAGREGGATLRDAFVVMATRSEPGGMCQLGFDNVGLLYSTCSSIAVLRTGELYISHGPPSRVEYVRYRLTDGPPDAKQ